MKYLVFKHADTEMERVYLFPEEIQHKDFAAMMPQKWKAVRGGMVSVYASDDTLCYHVFGDAWSLGLARDTKKDTALIKKQIEGRS